MEILFEFIFELIFESGIEASKNKKLPKYIRYPLVAIVSLFFIAVIGLIIAVGVFVLNENVLFGVFLILIGILMVLTSVIKFKKLYWVKKRDDNN